MKFDIFSADDSSLEKRIIVRHRGIHTHLCPFVTKMDVDSIEAFRQVVIAAPSVRTWKFNRVKLY